MLDVARALSARTLNGRYAPMQPEAPPKIVKLITRKPKVPTAEEIDVNVRSRSKVNCACAKSVDEAGDVGVGNMQCVYDDNFLFSVSKLACNDMYILIL